MTWTTRITETLTREYDRLEARNHRNLKDYTTARKRMNRLMNACEYLTNRPKPRTGG